jgi:hypothetical protein
MSIYKPESHVAFDIDGITLDTPAEMWKVFTSHLDIPASIDSWKEYYIEKQLGIPQASLRPLYEPILWRKDLPFVRGAARALREFYETTGEPVLFITARRPQFVESARVSIEKELPDVPIEIVATSERDSKPGDTSGHHKTDYLVDHGILFFVDDHPHSWQEYLDAGVCVGTLEWPWTRGPASKMESKHFKIFKDWDALGSLLDTGVRWQKLFNEMRSWPSI